MSTAGEVAQEVEVPTSEPTHGPGYLLSLGVQNVRCFGPAQILDLTDGHGNPARWTVILGDNGVGKTTLLQCLARVEGRIKQNSPTIEQTKAPTRPSWRPAITEDKEFSQRLLRNPEVKLQELSTNEAEFGSVVKSLVEGEIPTGEFSVVRYAWSYGTSLNRHATREKTRSTYLFAEDLAIEMSPAGDSLSHLICYAYGATRRLSAASISDSERADGTSSLFSEDAALVNAEEWLLQADYAALVDSPSQAQARARRDQIKETLVKLLPDVSEIRFVRPTEGKWTPRVEVETPYGWVRLRELSLGYKTLLAWISDLAFRMFERYPESSDPLAEPAIVLVDEIDLHLHPRWQRALIGYLTQRFPNTQFIVTAHSPLIVQAASNDANIVLLRRNGDHVVVENDVEAIHGWRIDQILTSDLFGLSSARPPEYDALMEERLQLLSKPVLTKADEERLAELESRVDGLPVGETSDDMRAMNLIRRIAEIEARFAD